MPYFEPPIVYDLPPTLPGRGIVNSHAKWKGGQRRGRSVLKKDGIYTTVDVPTSDQTLAADIYYAGGHVYEISQAEYDALIAAGYDPLLSYPGYILVEAGTDTDFLTTTDGEQLTDESSTPLGWDSLYTLSIVDGILIDESGNRLISEYV